MIAGEYHRGGGFLTKKEAQEAENLLSPNRAMAFGEVCDKYLTYIKLRGQSPAWIYEKKLFIKKHLKKWFQLDINSITEEDIESHIIQRGKEVSPYMGNKDLKFLKSIMNYALKMRWIDYNPCNQIKKLPEKISAKVLPSIEDFNKVLAIAPPLEKNLLILLYTTSARISEILSLKKSDCHENYIILRTRKHKGGSMREDKIILTKKGKKAIEWLLNSTSGDYLFTNNRTGTRYLRMPKRLKSLCKKAGVKPFMWHKIRDLSASMLADSGVPLPVISRRLRHQRVTTTDHYLQALSSGERKAIEVLDENIQ